MSKILNTNSKFPCQLCWFASPHKVVEMYLAMVRI